MKQHKSRNSGSLYTWALSIESLLTALLLVLVGCSALKPRPRFYALGNVPVPLSRPHDTDSALGIKLVSLAADGTAVIEFLDSGERQAAKPGGSFYSEQQRQTRTTPKLDYFWFSFDKGEVMLGFQKCISERR